MNWALGFSAAYYATIVDPVTWRDIERLEITGGSVSRTDGDLRISADLDFIDYDQSEERWVRVYLDAEQNEDIEHVALFTGLATSPDKDIKGTLIENSVECYSVLKPAEDILLDRGWYAPAETSGARLIKNLLSVTPAPVIEEDNSPLLSQAIIAEDGESNLTMINKILTAINWRLRIDGDGTVHIEPQASEAAASFDPLSNDVIEPKISVAEDWFNRPNVFRAIADDVSGVARDDSESSKLSTVNRGREVWMEETSCDLNNGETIAEYAVRRLKEEQQTAYTVSYDRRFDPNVVTGDIVRLHYPEQDLDGLFRVTSQSMTLTHGGTTSEEVVKI